MTNEEIAKTLSSISEEDLKEIKKMLLEQCLVLSLEVDRKRMNTLLEKMEAYKNTVAKLQAENKYLTKEISCLNKRQELIDEITRRELEREEKRKSEDYISSLASEAIAEGVIKKNDGKFYYCGMAIGTTEKEVGKFLQNSGYVKEKIESQLYENRKN